MDEFRVRLRLKHFNKIVPIEGGRIKRSQEIRDQFLIDVRESVARNDTLAGYAFVCWDDAGDTISTVTQADFGPYEDRDIPNVVRHEIRRALDSEPSDEDDETNDDEV